MNLNLNLSTDKPRRWRRRWWQFFTQFSLRTLLILVTASACACWWWLQPGSREEQLSGPYLKLRRQVRIVVPPAAPAVVNGAAPANVATSEPAFVNAGSWRLVDEHDNLIASGRYDQEAAEGAWTLYHENGRKAAAGRMLAGQRTGRWRTWDAEGRPVSEVTYRVAPSKLAPRPAPAFQSPWAAPTTPVVGVTPPLTGPGAPLLQFGCCFGGPCTFAPRLPEVPPEGGLRHGPARGWHSTGKLCFEGAYRDDLRSGVWNFDDEQGRFSARGEFLANQRHGAWIIRDPDTGKTRTEEYFAGLPRAEHERLIGQLREDLASGEIRRQVAAAQRLAEMGTGGLPLLWESVDHPSDDVKLLAVRGLLQLGALRDPELDPQALAKLDALTSHADPRLAARALLALYVARPDRRDECFTRLLPRLAAAGERNDMAFATMLEVYRTDERHRAEAVRLIVERLATLQAPLQGTDEFAVPIPAELIELGESLIPHLEVAYDTRHAGTRLAVVHVLRELVAQGESQSVQIAPGQWERHWPIPAAAQALLQQAQTDGDPRVKAAAERVRKDGPWSGFGGGGSGIPGGMSGSWGGFSGF